MIDLTVLGMSENHRGHQINELLAGRIDPLVFASVREWCDRSHAEQDSWFLKLVAIDSIIDGNGIETIVEDGKAIADYVNMGDPWIPTIVYDREKDEFVAATQGGFYEEWESENVINIDCKQLATIIHGLSHDPSIPWEECVEGDRDEYDSDEDFLEDAYVDIRLQVMDDHQWYFRSGDSQYDQDHRGAWGSSSVGKCVSMEDCMAISKDLIEQAAESADYNLTKQVRAYNDGN